MKDSQRSLSYGLVIGLAMTTAMGWVLSELLASFFAPEGWTVVFRAGVILAFPLGLLAVFGIILTIPKLLGKPLKDADEGFWHRGLYSISAMGIAGLLLFAYYPIERSTSNTEFFAGLIFIWSSALLGFTFGHLTRKK